MALPDSTYHGFLYGSSSNHDDDVTLVSTRGGANVTSSYDHLHHVTQKLGDATVNYTYDLTGRLLTAAVPAGSAHIPAGTWSIAYDTAGRRVTDTLPNSVTVNYSWDAAGNRTHLTFPDGTCIATSYDPLNRPT